MDIVATIVPIFVVITAGGLARWRRYIRPEFFNPANRLVYYLAIPAMIFRSVAGASLRTQFNFPVLVITIVCLAAGFGAAWAATAAARLERGKRGTFIQVSVHGNLGYIGLAVAYYYLGQEGLARASLLAGFIMIEQNLLAVVALAAFADKRGAAGAWRSFVLPILGNPIILSALAGIAYSLVGFPLPRMIDRSLGILADLALPMALLLIGASLSFEQMRRRSLPVLGACGIKLLVLPGLGLLLFKLCGYPTAFFLPALILLAAPTATVSYVMAEEMHGDGELAAAAISAATLLSAVTYTLWLNVAG
jgi:predicted permease